MAKENLSEVMTSSFKDAIEKIVNPIQKKGVTLIIPAYNEEKSVGKVIREAKKVKEISQIIVVNDGSKDNTSKIAQELGVDLIEHHENLGKGEALKTGISHAKGEIIAFVDADWTNIESKKIRAMILPIIKDKADFVKASFIMKRGRVTEIAVKPMMKVLYPETKFKQPISGQFAGKKEFFNKIEFEPRWGIDIAILLDAIKEKERVVEINVGEIIHKKRNVEEKAEMSKQVMETMLKKAGHMADKHQAILFSDNTIIKRNKISKKNEKLLEKLKKKKIVSVFITEKKWGKKTYDYFNAHKNIKEKSSAKDIVKAIQRFLKKRDIELKEAILIVNKSNFKELATKVDKALCFEKSSKTLKEKCVQINSLSEILIHIE